MLLIIKKLQKKQIIIKIQMKKNYVIIDSIERKKNLAKKNKAELYNAIKKIKI